LTRHELKTKLKPEILWCKIPMALDHIEQLESKVNRLIEKHERIKKEKESFEKRLQQKESEWHNLKGQIRQYERERTELREKLDKILGQFTSLDLPD
jgi:chromosome segregation ATPase